MIVDDMKKDWLALGLLLIIVSLSLLYYSNASVRGDSYVLENSVNNSNRYIAHSPAELSLTANLTAGQRLFFNFTKGRFWGVLYDQQHGLEPANTEFAPPSTSIEPYKQLELIISTPSGDTIQTEVYLVGGTQPFAVTYLNESADFSPLPGGNLTFTNVGVEGTAERTGNYAVRVNDIEPYVMQDLNHQYKITTDPNTGDPPLEMYLWTIDTIETKPYLTPLVLTGGTVLVVGALISVWSSKPRKKQHIKYTKRIQKKDS